MAFHVGTSGWHYKHWRGDFYPAGMPPARWFEHYARTFDTVELNASFYRQPKPAAWDLWRNEAPPGFLFAVKASRYITHIKRLEVQSESLDLLYQGARRLGEHLGPILYQLPPTFRRDTDNARRLEAFLERLPPDLVHVFEFRDRSWFTGATFEALDAHGAASCAFHMPALEAPLRVTGGVLYMRFHGSGALYGGNYEDDALRDWAAKLATAAKDAREAFVYFNNDIGGHAPRNAVRFRELLAEHD
jgi:uncharacterized protein YecE (DUF72 family)